MSQQKNLSTPYILLGSLLKPRTVVNVISSKHCSAQLPIPKAPAWPVSPPALQKTSAEGRAQGEPVFGGWARNKDRRLGVMKGYEGAKSSTPCGGSVWGRPPSLRWNFGSVWIWRSPVQSDPPATDCHSKRRSRSTATRRHGGRGA